MKNSYTVRSVREDDLPTLVEIEQERWAREGTEILTLTILKEWYANDSPFFLVAEKNGKIDGFYYAIQVDFSLSKIDAYTAPESQTHHGWSVHAHDPGGGSVYGINIVQRAAEAGIALNAEVYRRMRERRISYFVGIPRLVNLDSYLRSVERQNEGILPYDEEKIALWYAHESMKLLHQKLWEEATPQPALVLPPLRRPDSLLKFTVAAIDASFLRIIPNFMKDPKSRGYGAFLASDFTQA
jgi:hypothetical protein